MSIVDRWDAWWFPDSTGFRLAVCRVIVVATQLLVFMPSLEKQRALLAENDAFIRPQWLVMVISALGPDELLFSTHAFEVLYVMTVVAGVSCLIGLFTRPSAFLFALGNWVMISHTYSYGEEHHVEAVAGLFLMLLAFSPSGRRLSIDAALRRNAQRKCAGTVETTIWPIKLTQVVLAWSYFSNALAKLVYGGLQWINGYTMQQYLLADAITWELPLGLWLAKHHTIAVLASVATILFELLFFLVVIFPRTAPFILVSGALLHIGIYFAMGADFFQQIVMYVVFIDFDRWEERWRERTASWIGLLKLWARSRGWAAAEH